MSWTLSLFSLLILGSAVVAIVVGVGALRRRPDPLATPLAVMMLAVVVWAIPHAISLGFQDVETVTFWHQVRYPGTVAAPVLYLVLALRYAGYETWLSRRRYLLLGAIPAVTVLAVWTNPVHQLFWQDLAVRQIGDTTILTPTYGPVYWIDLAYLYIVTVVGLLLLATAAIRSGPLYRKQAILMFVGGLVPLVTNAVLTFDFLPQHTPDLTTTALAISGMTFALALFYFDLLEIRPVARDQLLAELEDGVVVIGPNGRIRDFNRIATDILGDIYVEQDAQEVLPADVTPDGGELVVDRNGTEHTYRTRSSSLTDHHGREIGRIVYLNDITDLVRREQRISVLNRVLRHNLRNEINLALAHLELVGAEVSSAGREHVAEAVESMEGVIDMAEKARNVERTLQRGDSSRQMALGPTLREAVERSRERFADAEIGWDPGDLDEELTVRVVDEDLFITAIGELVENAIRHHDCTPPEVTVSVSRADDSVHIHVRDTGPGIPQSEQDVLTARTESPLEHGSGLGLWLVRWTIALSGGSLSFEANDPRGSVVVLSIPIATEPDGGD